MKATLTRLPVLFNILYLLVSIIEIIIILSSKSASNSFITNYSAVADKTYWIALVGLVLHVLSYLANLDQGWLLFADILGIFGFLIFALLPQFFYAAIVLIILAIILTVMKHRKPMTTE